MRATTPIYPHLATALVEVFQTSAVARMKPDAAHLIGTIHFRGRAQEPVKLRFNTLYLKFKYR
jgi:hypothetical protein